MTWHSSSILYIKILPEAKVSLNQDIIETCHVYNKKTKTTGAAKKYRPTRRKMQTSERNEWMDPSSSFFFFFLEVQTVNINQISSCGSISSSSFFPKKISSSLSLLLSLPTLRNYSSFFSFFFRIFFILVGRVIREHELGFRYKGGESQIQGVEGKRKKEGEEFKVVEQ